MISSRLVAIGRALARARPLLAACVVIVGVTCRDATGPHPISADGANPMLSMSASATTVQVGAFVTLTFDFNGNKQSTWVSSDTTIATVVPLTIHTARVYGQRPGRATIRASAGRDADSTAITVIPVPVASVTLAPDSASIQRLDTLPFVATARDANGNVLAPRPTTWLSTDTVIASVSSTGRAAARTRGTASIIATVEGHADTARFVVRQAQLTISSMSAPDSVSSGDGFWLRYSVQNLWDSPNADSVIVRIGYRDSAGAVFGAQRRALPRVAGGATVKDSAIVNISGSPGRAASVVAYVDCRDGTGGTENTYLAACLANPASAGSIAEGEETDNTRSANVRLGLPNLMISAVAPPSSTDTVYTRGSVNRRYRLQNEGSAAGSGFEYIVGLRDMTTQSFVTTVGSTYSGLLGTRQTDTVAVTLNIPALDPSHVYQFWAATDCPSQGDPAARLNACFTQRGSGSVVPELNELDNVDVYAPFVVASNLARVVAPDSVLLSAIGDTTRLAPIAYDRASVKVTDASFTFVSLDSGIISATAGLLRANAAGIARVVSLSEGRADTTRVYVVQVPARVASSPRNIALYSFGDTATFTAAVQDRNGNPIPGDTVAWTSLNPTVASIAAPGTAVAHANGSAGIVAARDGHADTSWVNVTQGIARIVVAPDSSFLAKAGDTTRLVATTFDARGNAIPAPASLSWNALDPAGATVDSLGLVTAVAPWTGARVVATSGVVADTVRVTVGGGPNPVPVVTAVTPATTQVIAAPPLVVVTGTGFLPVSVIRVNGSDRPTEFVSATELRTQATAADVAAPGSFTVVVFNPAPSGGTSSTRWVPIVSPTPVITSVSPTSIPVNSGDTVMTVIGTGFIPQSQATVDGWNAKVTFVSTTELRMTAPANRLFYPHNPPVMVINPDPANIPDNISNRFPFEVRATPPVITSLSPSQALAGSTALNVRIKGSGFFLNSTARFNGVDHPTTLVDSNTVDIVLSEVDLSAAGTFPITVFTDGPGGGISNTMNFVLTEGALNIGLLPSTGAQAGGPGFTLTVHGTGFAPGAQVLWNGSPRPSQYVSPTRITAQISAADVATPGTAPIAVTNPDGQATPTLTMTVRTPGAATATSTSRMTLNARDLVWDDRTGRIYLSVPGSAPANANSIVAVDPVTGTATGSAVVGSDPTRLARSDDGQFVYVGLDGVNAVRRVDLASLTPGLQWSLRTGEVAGQIRALPGMPGSVAISGHNPGISPSFIGVTIFDNGIARPQISPPHTGGSCIEFLDSPSVLYGYDDESSGFEFFTIGVDALGARHLDATSNLISGFSTKITGGAGRIYGSDGSVVDAERRLRVGSLAGSGSAILVEPSTGRAYVLTMSGIVVYDINTFQNLGTVPVPGVVFGQSGLFGGQRLVRWGSDGIAFLDDDELFMVRSPIFAP